MNTTLTTREDPIEPNVYRIHAEGNWLLRIQHNGEQTVEQQRDNIERLAACWNKFKGIPTDMIESLPGDIASLARAHARALLKADALHALIKRVEAAAHDDTAWAAFRQQVIDCTSKPAAPDTKH